MQVTLSLLPVSLSLVHIPRSRLDSLSHPLLRQLLHPNPAFLNITCNEIELSIFAEHYMLRDFEPVARRDRHRQRSRSDSSSGRKNSNRGYEPIEISYEKWSVLQIDSHSDQIDNSGTRVYDLSAPLAAAGISILYQSSYMSDFIFVKESRLQETMNLFAEAGFHLYNSDSNPSFSPIISPSSDGHSFTDYLPNPANGMGTILTRNLSDHDLALSSPCPQTTLQSPRSKSHSPTSGEVRVLPSDLACVGLSDEFGVDHWGLKIIKLVAFPDLITPSYPQEPSVIDLTTASLFLTRRGSESSSSSSSSDEDGYFSHSPQNVSTTSLSSNTSRSYDDLRCLSYKSPSKHVVTPLSTVTPKPRTTVLTESFASPRQASHVPFFSFTRTSEGSSLTADVHVLATLFPQHERHMVICSGELDAADLRLEEGMDFSDEEDEFDEADADDDASCRRRSHSLKCLQIDLRRFGLDKHGLVNRFSRVLEENGINHMYSSTFKTANLLVDKKDAVRAQSLLRSC